MIAQLSQNTHKYITKQKTLTVGKEKLKNQMQFLLQLLLFFLKFLTSNKHKTGI